MALGVSFRDDFFGSYNRDAEASRRYEDEMDQYRLAAARRTDTAGRYAEEDAAAQRSVFSGAREQIGSRDPGSTPLGSAFMYATSLASIVTQTNAGKLEDAYAEFDRLDKQADAFLKNDIAVASTRPNNDFEKSLQMSAQARSQKQYLSQPVELPDGTKTTLGSLFRDGQSYKKFSYDSVMRSSFSREVSDSYHSDDPFRASVFREIVDPVVKDPRRKVGGSHEYKTQFYDVAEYVNRDFDDMKSELGEKGFHRLVMDVVEKRVSKGVAVEMMDRVRDYVYAQRQADPNADPAELVRKSIGQFDRMCKSISDPSKPIPDDVTRYVSKVMTAVTENSRGAVDFDDDRTRAAMDAVTRTVADFDRLGVKLMPLMDEGRSDVSKSFAEYVESVSSGAGEPESNILTRLGNTFRVTTRMFSAGATPADAPVKMTDPRTGRDNPSVVLGYTTGNDGVDFAVMRMVAAMNRKYLVPMVSGGLREDLAIQKMFSDHGPELVEDWTRSMSTFTGMPKSAARACVETMVRQISEDGGAGLVDPMKTMQSLVFSDDLYKRDPQAAVGLRRWMKSSGVAGKVLADAKSELVSTLMDPDVGMGLQGPQAIAVANSYVQSAIAMMEAGANGPGWLKQQAGKGRAFIPTGKFTVPGQVDDAGQPKQFDVKELEALLRKSGQTPAKFWASVIPAVTMWSGQLNKLSYGAVKAPGVYIPGVSPGQYVNDRAAVAASQRQLKELVERNAKKQTDAEKKLSNSDDF